MDGQYQSLRNKYNEKREKIITSRYKDAKAVEEVRGKWMQFDENIFAIVHHFSLLPKYASFINEIAFQSALHYFYSVNQLGPTDDEGIKHWTKELFDRLRFECNLNWLDLGKWQKKVIEQWRSSDISIPSPLYKKQDPSEKKNLEKFCLDEFLPEYNSKTGKQYTIEKMNERPDAYIIDQTGSRIGIEITHLNFDQSEAKILHGRSNTNYSGLQSFSELINTLEARIENKKKSISDYKKDTPIILLIGVASPIFTFSQFDQTLKSGNLVINKEPIDDIWILVSDDDYQEKYHAIQINI